MRTEAVHAIRMGEYHYIMVECALPVILAAREIGCTTGEHLAEFLSAVGVPPPYGGFESKKVGSGDWIKNSANRAVRYLVKHGLLEWPRHRGKRNPILEANRKELFAAAVKKCRKKEGYDAIHKTLGARK